MPADGRAEPDVVFASGLGTIDDDLREADACRRLFPPPAPVQITAATGALGMTGAASGAFALVHALAGMSSGTIAPTTGYERCDPRCAVPIVREGRHGTLSHALVWTSDGARHVALSIGSVS
jgi:3-oxoacyl-(acyl-carrier-protein) synthase